MRGEVLNSTSRVAAVLAVAVVAFGLAQTASAAGLALSVGVEAGAVAVSADVSAPVANASARMSTAPTAPAASASAALDTGPVASRVDVAVRRAAAPVPRDPRQRTGKDRGALPGKGGRSGAQAPHDRSAVVVRPSAGTAPLDLLVPLAERGPGSAPAADLGLAPLSEESSRGWAQSVQAAVAAGVSTSPAALAALLLVLVTLILRPVPCLAGPPRRSLHLDVLQRPG